tara:strand:- start:2494 stop:6072 length:3579 start_codon:yes stop_codon:yes gene_type:complete
LTFINEIEILKKRLISSTIKSIFSNAHPKKSLDKIDFIELFSINKNPNISPNEIIKSLFSNTLFKANFNVDYKQLEKNRSKRKLLHLYRKNVDLIHEINHDSFGLGYPLLCLPDHKRKSLRFIPLFIWDLKISYALDRLDQLIIQKSETSKVYLNPLIKDIIMDEFHTQFIDLSILNTENIKLNYSQLIKNIAFALQIPSIDLEFGKKEIFSLKNSNLKYSPNILPKIINNGVFGLYNNSKAPVINDYKTILDTYRFDNDCLFDKKEVSKVNLNSTIFSGVKLDYSQQKVLKSIQCNNDIVIHGPPGTGKSKTITGVITYALSQGKTCVVICEKKTAIDVIYSNLRELGFSEFCIRIDDVKLDRRKVVNKVRDIISKNDKNKFNLFDTKSRKNITSKDRALIEKKQEHINNIISEIKFKKEKIYKTLLNATLTYSDLVLTVNSETEENQDIINNLNEFNFNFNSNEYNSILSLFSDIKKHLLNEINPYNSIYEYLNLNILETSNQHNYNKIISNLYKNYFKELISLQQILLAETAKKSAIKVKYYNFISGEKSSLSGLIQKLNALKKEVLQMFFFNKTFERLLNKKDIIKQVEFLLKIIHLGYSEKDNYESLVSFYNQNKERSRRDKTIVTLFCKNINFENCFNGWYFKAILENNHVDNFNFNGNQKGYYDLIEDIDLISDFLIHQTSLKLTQIRSKAISNFSKRHKSLSIERFFSKKSSHNRKKLSLREISSHPSKIFNSFFPLVLTSPSSCSTLFPLEKDFFDIVVFDESSQIKVEDTFPAMYRGKQRIVAGDLNQLSPMNYFSKSTLKSNSTVNNNFLSNSLLDYCIEKGFKEHYLDIHYRSKNPDLITFSNHAFYKSRLIPLPRSTNEKAMEYFEVNGVFENGVNKEEARKIIHYIDVELDASYSLGIATFNMLQRDEILDQIQIKSSENPFFQKKIKQIESNGFFVKNLENIQGEERDIIIISSTYGETPDGQFRQSFGPINSIKKGFKLLNVIITRAKYKMIVFCSIPQPFISRGLKMLEELNENKGKSILYAFLAFVKSVSIEDNRTKEKIIQILKNNSSKSSYLLKNDNGVILENFSNKLIKIINKKSDIIVSKQNNFALGGFVYELCLVSSSGIKILVDLNGKLLHGDYEDYLFDINRSNLAIKSGFKYYRLWASNLQNNFDQEIYKFISFIKNNDVIPFQTN